MPTVYVHQPESDGSLTACTYYRAVLPVRHCQPHLPDISLKLSQTFGPEDEHHDVFLFHKFIRPTFLPVVQRLKSKGKTIVWQADDDPFSIPEWNPAHRGVTPAALDTLRTMLDLADAIVVSTEPLKTTIGQEHKTTVLPNLIDLNDWPEPLPRDEDDDRVRILWTGSVHHDLDLEEIVEPLDLLLTEFKDRLQVVFFGDMPDSMAEFVRIKYSHLGTMVPAKRYQGRVVFLPPVELNAYPESLVAIQPDIALCPLARCDFNNSKSNIKWLECTMAGAAVVGTHLPPYLCIEDRRTGRLVLPDDPEGWYETLKALIEEPVTRQGMHLFASLDVQENYAWDGEAKWEWVKWFKEVVA